MKRQLAGTCPVPLPRPLTISLHQSLGTAFNTEKHFFFFCSLLNLTVPFISKWKPVLCVFRVTWEDCISILLFSLLENDPTHRGAMFVGRHCRYVDFPGPTLITLCLTWLSTRITGVQPLCLAQTL